ncbi:biotin-dependent carboxyltransferase family protein [Algoriphagus sp.]|uniref:5-oxoprolinase subunit C family protein n=1 Tax=Algoriphagus sp. TaxID=1872435 RepID=UPI00262C8F61|nr:biotin-dependent carboxyltransferase family protein [Algoriphagus sp.]
MIRDPAFAKILKTGPGSKIIDQGRKGMGEFGIPNSGPLDQQAFQWVNLVLRNPLNAAVLEITQPGFAIHFPFPTLICLAGASANIKLNGVQLLNPSLIELPEDSLLEVGAFKQGALLYLGIKQGFQSELSLGSRSFFEGITPKSQFSKGDSLLYYTNQEIPNLRAKPVFDRSYLNATHIEVYLGPEWELLPEKIKAEILHFPLKLSAAKNRMGIQLDSPFENSVGSIVTVPVYPGTVQLTPSGMLIALLQDAQVTGGYPRIFQIAEKDLSRLAQKNVGSQIQFTPIKS